MPRDFREASVLTGKAEVDAWLPDHAAAATGRNRRGYAKERSAARMKGDEGSAAAE